MDAFTDRQDPEKDPESDLSFAAARLIVLTVIIITCTVSVITF